MGTLYLVSTPIGNLEDITVRAIKTLVSVDYIACEDTRITGRLLEELTKRYAAFFPVPGVKQPKLISYHDAVEDRKLGEITELLKAGFSVALVSDAGTPLLNDPGYPLVQWAIKKGVITVAVPGPHAATTALVLSGLPTHNYLFLGYPPEKELHLVSLLRELEAVGNTTRNLKPTVMFYCAPHKLDRTLRTVLQVLGNIHIVIARELTKIHEEVWRGHVAEALEYFTEPKGEIVVLFTLQ